MTEMIRMVMTADEFLKRPNTNPSIELINGERVVTGPTDRPRQTLASNLILKLYRLTVGDGALHGSPTNLYLDEYNIYQPEVFWLSGQNNRWVLKGGLYCGAPDLVIEVFSPNIEPRDKDAKFEVYDRYGVLEYWMIDLLAGYMEVWSLPQNKCLRLSFLNPKEKFMSPVLYNQTIWLAPLFRHVDFT
ncbi:MAG: Uma2 family endonuclease [Anaerolineae bacterium]|nr:Uma2 family endonuclease [Anaerolineae bacterium]